MAITSTTGSMDALLDAGRTFLNQTRDRVIKARAKRTIYRTTHHELSLLSDRGLNDLGISRCDIRRLAQEAADDC